MSNIFTGKQGEILAKDFLEKQGYKILETNKRFSKLCEIDIIALDKKTLVFAEVKTRTSEHCGSPFEAITKTKYIHIKTGIILYLEEHKEYNKYSVYAISVILKP